MFWIRTLAAVLVAAVAVSAEDKKPDDKKPTALDAKTLAGTWTLVSGMKAGEKSDAKSLEDPAVFAGDKITFKSPAGNFEFKYTLDATKDGPAAIDMEILAPADFKGAKSKGIIGMEGETLTLAYNPTPDGARPKDFKSTKDNGSHVYTMKKAKKDEKKDDKKDEKKDDK